MGWKFAISPCLDILILQLDKPFSHTQHTFYSCSHNIRIQANGFQFSYYIKHVNTNLPQSSSKAGSPLQPRTTLTARKIATVASKSEHAARRGKTTTVKLNFKRTMEQTRFVYTIHFIPNKEYHTFHNKRASDF